MTELPYDREKEAAMLARDLIRLRPRLQRLVRNLDHSFDTEQALKYLDLAAGSVAKVGEFR